MAAKSISKSALCRALLLLVMTSIPARAQAEPSVRFEDIPAPPAPRTEAASIARAASTVRVNPRSWATERASSFVTRAERHLANGDVAFALSAYTEAIQSDSTFGPAYLGLGRLRDFMGDFVEADRLFTMASHVPEVSAEALALRAGMLRRLGRIDEALRDLERAVRLDPTAHGRLKELAAWYAERRAWPAALAVWRMLRSELELRGADASALTEARVRVQALSLLAGETDPLVSGRTHPSWVRRALSRAARR